MRIEVGQTWKFYDDLWLIVKIDPTEYPRAMLLNLETGEVNERYPMRYFTDRERGWARIVW